MAVNSANRGTSQRLCEKAESPSVVPHLEDYVDAYKSVRVKSPMVGRHIFLGSAPYFLSNQLPLQPPQ
jgi:hypothetical protein